MTILLPNLWHRFYLLMILNVSYLLRVLILHMGLGWIGNAVCLTHGFKNRNGQRTGKEADYRFYGPTGVGSMVKPMMS